MERERREGESDQIEEDPEVPKAPVYHPRVKIAMKPQGHQYLSSSFKRASTDTCTKGISCKESGCEAWSNYSCCWAAEVFKALTLILQLVNHRICGLNQVWVIQVDYCSTLWFLAELFRGMLFKWKGANKKSHQKWDFIVNLVLWLVKQRVTWYFSGDFWRKTTTNHHETTTENHHEPPQTTTNHYEPPRTTTNHYKPPRTTTKSHSKWDLILNLGLWLVK